MTKTTYSILLIEQEKKIYDLVEKTLKELDECCITKIFKDYQEALEHIRSSEFYELPQLIYLNMDIDSGKTFEFLEGVKSNSEYRRIPVIVFTKKSEPEKTNKAYKFYANSIIELPEDEEKLAGLVKESWQFWLKTVKLPQRDALI